MHTEILKAEIVKKSYYFLELCKFGVPKKKSHLAMGRTSAIFFCITNKSVNK